MRTRASPPTALVSSVRHCGRDGWRGWHVVSSYQTPCQLCVSRVVYPASPASVFPWSWSASGMSFLGMRLALLMLALVALVVAPDASTLDPARAFLMTTFNLSAAEIGRIDGGQVVSRTLDVKNRREVATLGIVHIKTTPSMYVERLTDITAFKR